MRTSANVSTGGTGVGVGVAVAGVIKVEPANSVDGEALDSGENVGTGVAEGVGVGVGDGCSAKETAPESTVARKSTYRGMLLAMLIVSAFSRSDSRNAATRIVK